MSLLPHWHHFCNYHSSNPSLSFCTGAVQSTFAHSLAVQVLSVDPFLKPKYTYSGILADHISVGTMLQICPQLPMESMDAMGYQSLAPHVRSNMYCTYVTHFISGTSQSTTAHCSVVVLLLMNASSQVSCTHKLQLIHSTAIL